MHAFSCNSYSTLLEQRHDDPTKKEKKIFLRQRERENYFLSTDAARVLHRSRSLQLRCVFPSRKRENASYEGFRVRIANLVCNKKRQTKRTKLDVKDRDGGTDSS